MGGCLSRKKESLNVAPNEPVVTIKSFDDVGLIKKKVVVEEEDKVTKKRQVVLEERNEEESSVKKEIFVIKHRKSHDKERGVAPSNPDAQKNVSLVEDRANDSANSGEMGAANVSNVVVRTSSCTKEEVDAILIQCGRLSRSNSSGKVVASSGRKYSGSKRSYDLDQDQEVGGQLHQADAADFDARKRGNSGSYCHDDEDDEMGTERRQHRQRHRQSGRPSPSSPSKGRRRTPSREREQQRSGSRERSNGSGTNSGRRVSRSPGRRTEGNSVANSSTGTNSGGNNSTTSGTGARPGKMVSVPATVSSLTMDKSNIGFEPQTANGVKRISVMRNVGAGESGISAGSRTAASPRSQSPARTNAKSGGCNDSNQQQQPSLSRNSSRKAEHSPYRRNPLSEIDTNSLVYAQTTGNNKPANNNSSSKMQTRNKELDGQNQAQMQKPNAETNGIHVSQGPNDKAVEDAKVAVADVKPQTLTRSRSARRSRDLDFNPEVLLNPNPSYTALLLEDIQNFHQKSTNTNTPSFSVPPCLTKACSILEAVADLNSTTSSNIVGRKLVVEPTKDPFVESEILANNDLMEPSFHKYVTVRRGGSGKATLSVADDMDGQESSGSNSYIGGSSSQQHWGYSTSSSWEPNSADSTDRWTSRSNTRDEEEKKGCLHTTTTFESGREVEEEARRRFSGQRNGIGRGRLAAAAAST